MSGRPPEAARFTLVRYHRLAYAQALERQRALAGQVRSAGIGNHLLLLEHPPVYTIGRSGTPAEVFEAGIPVRMTDRGGRVTYHGPGQLVAYVIRDLGGPFRGVRAHVALLEETAIRTLAACGVHAGREAGNPGVWVDGAKIGALGVRVQGGVAYHGLALNRDPDLERFRGIVPCGLSDRRVTSLAGLGVAVSRAELETRFLAAFRQVFNARWTDRPATGPNMEDQERP